MPVKVGIVGNGWWVDSMYLPALASSAHGQVVAIAGRSREKTETIANRWNIPHRFSGDSGYKGMLPFVDAVIVASSTHSHFEISRQCLLAGKHVLCEKPLGLSASECRELVQLARSKSLVNQVAFTYSYMPEMKYLIDFCAKNSASRFSMEWNAGFMLDVGHAADKHNALIGNSVFSDVGSHFIYLAQQMFGKIETVHFLPVRSKIADSHGFKSSELGGYMSLKFASGTVGTISIQTDSKLPETKFNMIQTISITSDKSDVVVINDWSSLPKISVTDSSHIVRDESHLIEKFTDAVLTSDAIENYKRIFRSTNVMARAFVRSIDQGEMIEATDFQAGLNVQCVLDAAHKSGRTGASELVQYD